MVVMDAKEPRHRTDEYAGVVPARLSKDVLRSLSEISPARFLARVVLDWALYLGAVYLCEAYWNPLLYVITVLWIGGRLNALSVLMHEATHRRAFRSARVNDWVGEVLLAWPLAITLHGYRSNHFLHHRHLNTAEDPDWERNRPPQFQFPRTRGSVLVELLKYLSFINLPLEVKQLMRSKHLRDNPWHIELGRGVFLLTVVGLSIYFHFWKLLLLYWVVPFATTFLLFIYLRSIAEHYGGMEYDDPLTQTRTVLPAWWERWFFGPHNINYHLEHHLYPSVPCHNLPKLHAALMQDPVYRERAHVTEGYLRGVMREVEWDRPRPEAVKID